MLSDLAITVCAMSEFASETNEARAEEVGTIGASATTDQDPALQKDPSEWVNGDDPITSAHAAISTPLPVRPVRNCRLLSARRRHRNRSID